MFNNDFEDFLNNPSSFGSNSKNFFFRVLNFPGASELQKGQGQRAWFKIFETNAMG
jgi:hypothetical protein